MFLEEELWALVARSAKCFLRACVVGLVACKTQTRFYSLAPTLRMRIRPDFKVFFAQN